jgi:hypothetical protein
MDCELCDKLLCRHSAGLVSGRRLQTLKAHLGTCRRCSREWERVGRVLDLVERYGGVDPPRDLWMGIAVQLQIIRPAIN